MLRWHSAASGKPVRASSIAEKLWIGPDLDFAGRQAQIVGVLAKSLKARAGARDVGTGVSVEIGGKQVLISPRAIPAAMGVASAREMVGQPFLKDFEAHEALESEAMVGPVHLIGCHKSVSEPQALRILGDSGRNRGGCTFWSVCRR